MSHASQGTKCPARVPGWLPGDSHERLRALGGDDSRRGHRRAKDLAKLGGGPLHLGDQYLIIEPRHAETRRPDAQGSCSLLRRRQQLLCVTICLVRATRRTRVPCGRLQLSGQQAWHWQPTLCTLKRPLAGTTTKARKTGIWLYSMGMVAVVRRILSRRDSAHS